MKSGLLSDEERKQIQQALIWFNINLPVPKAGWIHGRAIFWFKSGAKECIDRMWELVRLLQAHNYYVEVHKCEFLCNVVYSDEFQVAAFPHRRDGKRTIK